MNVEPIGLFHCSEEYPYDAARQGAVAHASVGRIELATGNNYEQALTDLEGFSHIWVVFQFHKNERWKPMVQPPRSDRKVGVFASRAPYRPNGIGLSCVRLGRIDGRTIEVFDHDLLNGTPILDIKPYLPYADSFPDAVVGWVEEVEGEVWDVQFSHAAVRQLKWLLERDTECIESFLRQQLSFEPTNANKKRVQPFSANEWEIAYRTWRARFNLVESPQVVSVQSITSGYNPVELFDDADPYDDKETHRDFMRHFHNEN